MKKVILSVLAIAGLTLSSYGQGVIYFDGSGNTDPSPSATTGGQVFIGGVLDTGTDINSALWMYNPLTSSYVNVVTLLLSQSVTTTTVAFGSTQPALGDITYFGGGAPFDAAGNGYQETFLGSGAGTFMVQAWTGDYSSFAAAMSSGLSSVYAGQSASFTVTLTSPTGTANSIITMPALLLTPVPEPTTLALAGLGGLSLLLFRRKQS